MAENRGREVFKMAEGIQIMNNVHYDNLRRMLAIADEGPVVLSQSGTRAIRWALSMINVLGDEVADQSGLPIPVVLKRIAGVVETSRDFVQAANEKIHGDGSVPPPSVTKVG